MEPRSEYFVLRVLEDGTAEIMDRDEMDVEHYVDYKYALDMIKFRVDEFIRKCHESNLPTS
jgi:hypothetical protein